MYKFFNFLIILFFITLCKYVFCNSPETVTTRLLQVNPNVLIFQDNETLNKILDENEDSITSPIIYIVFAFIISGLSLYGGIYSIRKIDLVPPRINKEYKDFQQNAQNKNGSKLKNSQKGSSSISLPASIALGLKHSNTISKSNKSVIKKSTLKNVSAEIIDPYNIK
uniref:Uncharacterized protein n=1 Tax=Strongyloides stercoralis TaxID=6248 RepID=A0A0K0EHH0_STRER